MVILGSDSDIAQAIIQILTEVNPDISITTLSRKMSPNSSHYQIPSDLFQTGPEQFDKSWESIIDEYTAQRKKNNHEIDLAISCLGFLHEENNPQNGPEKSIRQINATAFLKSFEANYLQNAFFAKLLKNNSSRQNLSHLCFLSAKVGSISDNKIGGWYNYRASKSALNMLVKNLSIELERNKALTKVISIHPGTTHTKLSRPFSQGVKHKVWNPEESAHHILQTIFSSDTINGEFYHWDGSKIEW